MASARILPVVSARHAPRRLTRKETNTEGLPDRSNQLSAVATAKRYLRKSRRKEPCPTLSTKLPPRPCIEGAVPVPKSDLTIHTILVPAWLFSPIFPPPACVAVGHMASSTAEPGEDAAAKFIEKCIFLFQRLDDGFRRHPDKLPVRGGHRQLI